MIRILLTHTPDVLANYYGERALAGLRALGEVRINPTGNVLDAAAFAEAARGCEIIVSDRQTPGPAEFFRAAPDRGRISSLCRRHSQYRRRRGERRGRSSHARKPGLHRFGRRNGASA